MVEKSKLETIRELILRALFRTEADTDKNSSQYWNIRWRLRLQHDKLTSDIRSQLLSRVKESMDRNGCANILEVGCGAIVPLREISTATHLDFSLKALQHSGLDSFICADITKGIPVPDKTFDATFSSSCLIHIPDEHIEQACAEIRRVTKKVIILNEGSQRDLAQYFDGLICEQPFLTEQTETTGEYDHTEYFTHGENITDGDWESVTMHSCPECNPSEHVIEKSGMYICAFCSRAWKNHFKKPCPKCGGVMELWSEVGRTFTLDPHWLCKKCGHKEKVK